MLLPRTCVMSTHVTFGNMRNCQCMLLLGICVIVDACYIWERVSVNACYFGNMRNSHNCRRMLHLGTCVMLTHVTFRNMRNCQRMLHLEIFLGTCVILNACYFQEHA